MRRAVGNFEWGCCCLCVCESHADVGRLGLGGDLGDGGPFDRSGVRASIYNSWCRPSSDAVEISAFIIPRSYAWNRRDVRSGTF